MMRPHGFARTKRTEAQATCAYNTGARKVLLPKATYSNDGNSCTHSWNAEERLILKILKDNFENEWGILALIFNTIFRHTVSKSGLSKEVLQTQYRSVTRDPRCCITSEKLWEMVLSSPRPSFKTENDGLAMIEEAALDIGVHLNKRVSSTQSAALDAFPEPLSTAKRSFNSFMNDEPVLASANIVSDSFNHAATPPPRKRWSGLDQRTLETPQTSSCGLLTPPSSERSDRYTNIWRPRAPESPTKKLYNRDSASRTGLSNFRLDLRSSPTPSLSPESDAETEYFSANSSPTFVEGASGEGVLKQKKSPSKGTKKTRAKSGYFAVPTSDLDVPLLGYRAFSNFSHGFNTEKRFVSGLYQHSLTIPLCPDINDNFYITEAEKHVGRTPSPSPFISLSGTPLRAMILAFGFQRRKSCTGSYLAIINLKILKEAGLIQKAKNLSLRPGRKYCPANEFLVWGEIKCEAIVSVINIAELIASPPRHLFDPDPLAIAEIAKHWRSWFVWNVIKKINRENQVFLSCCMGYAVGQFPRILRLPEYCMQAAVDDIVQDWGLTCSKHERWQDNEIFCNFVQKGYDGDDISKTPLDTKSVVTIKVKEEEFSPSLSSSPIIVLSDDETDDGGAGPEALIQDLNKADAAPGVSLVNDEDKPGTYKSQNTDNAFAALPTYYDMEMEMEIDKVNEKHESRLKQPFALLAEAYEMEMADLGWGAKQGDGRR